MTRVDLAALIALLRAADCPGGAGIAELSAASGLAESGVYRYLDYARGAPLNVALVNESAGSRSGGPGLPPARWRLLDWGGLNPDRLG